MSNWFFLALGAMIFFAGMTLTIKRLTYDVSTTVILFYLCAFITVFIGIFKVARGSSFVISGGQLAFVAFAALLGVLGNICDLNALRLAPNAGFASAVKAGQVLIVTFAVLFLFHDQKLSLSGLAGVLMVFGGLCLLAIQRS